MKRYIFLAAFAYIVLAISAVWFGGLNQDEGWYLYAANMVAGGAVPYRDFAYTQGPLLPILYSAFSGVWNAFGLLGARILTALIGLASIAFACALARMLVRDEDRRFVSLVTFFLLGVNLYHLYYTVIPKTYALASLFLLMGFYLLAFAYKRPSWSKWLLVASGISLAFASGARISLGAVLAVVGFGLLINFRESRWNFLWFGIGGVLGLALVYGPFVIDGQAFDGLCAAQSYHAARGGFDPVFTIGSLSRLVRWYLPVFIVFGLSFVCDGSSDADRSAPRLIVLLLFASFAAVFLVQMAAPFPYEDYQVPIMGLIAVAVAVRLASSALSRSTSILLVFGLSYAAAFGSPLLEEWTTDGLDRFWSLKKDTTELAKLRATAKEINRLDPEGKMLLTQDLYLAIETGRKVPAGLEMGPFSMLTDEEWRKLLNSAPCEIAALSGYTFAVNPPRCDERPIDQQMEYWGILKKNYKLVDRIDAFGQNSTPLLILKKK